MTTEKKEVKEVTETVKDNKEIAKETEIKETETKEVNKEDKAITRKRRTTTKITKPTETVQDNRITFQAYITKEELELIQRIQKEKTLDNSYKVLMYLVNNYFDNKDLVNFLLNKVTETEKEVKTSKGIVLDYFAEYDNNDKAQLNNRINKDLLKSWNEFINSNSQIRGNDLLSQAMYEFMRNHSK